MAIEISRKDVVSSEIVELDSTDRFLKIPVDLIWTC